MKMHIETKSTHISAANSNLFKELGFAPNEAKKLHAESQLSLIEILEPPVVEIMEPLFDRFLLPPAPQ